MPFSRSPFPRHGNVAEQFVGGSVLELICLGTIFLCGVQVTERKLGPCAAIPWFRLRVIEINGVCGLVDRFFKPANAL